MKTFTYETRVRRRRGRWRITVPALPGDSPVLDVDKLDNAPVLMIEKLAAYLGVSMQSISVNVEHPVRPPKRSFASRISATGVQLLGGAGALAGVYLVAGIAATLIAAGIASVALGMLRESGRI